MTEEEKSTTVPYLSAAKMEKVLELVSERSLSSISPDYFVKYNFGNADAYLAVNALKFLGVLDKDGKTTDLARKFQLRGDTRDKEVEAAIRKAYSKLFGATDNPHELPKDELVNEFMHHYKLSRRIAKSAVPAFLKLCEFAGLKEPGSVLTRRRTSSSPKAKTQSSTGSSVSKRNTTKEDVGDGNTPVPFAKGKMRVILPTDILVKTSFDEELDADWKSLVKNLTTFAEKHLAEGGEEKEKEDE